MNNYPRPTKIFDSMLITILFMVYTVLVLKSKTKKSIVVDQHSSALSFIIAKLYEHFIAIIYKNII